MWGHAFARVGMSRSGDGFSQFFYAGPGDQLPIIRLDDECPYLLSHFSVVSPDSFQFGPNGRILNNKLEALRSFLSVRVQCLGRPLENIWLRRIENILCSLLQE